MPECFCTRVNTTNSKEGAICDTGEKHTAEKIVSLLRHIDVAVANRKTKAQRSKETLTTDQTYYRSPEEYSRLRVD